MGMILQIFTLKYWISGVNYSYLPQDRDQYHIIYFPNFPSDTRVKDTFVARSLLASVAQKLCRCEHSVFTSRTYINFRTFFMSKLFCAVREAFSNTYSGKGIR
jgi:hypothetical protein